MKLNKVKQWVSTPVPKDTDSKAVTCSGQHCTLPSVSVWTVEVAVSMLPSYFQVSVSNAREISLKYELALSSQSVCGTEFQSTCLTLPNTLFSLYFKWNQSYDLQYGMNSLNSKKVWRAGEKLYVIVSGVCIILNTASLVIIAGAG